MKSLSKPWEAASVLVRLGGILHLCCDSPGLVEPFDHQRKIGFQKPYRTLDPLIYHRGKFINSPRPPNPDIYRNGHYGNLENNKENHRTRIEAIRRNIPALKRYRSPHADTDTTRNILQFRDIEISTMHPPQHYMTQPWMSKDIEIASTLQPPDNYKTTTENPWLITDTPSVFWDSTHWVPGERYTILPTISVVSPWDELHSNSPQKKDSTNLVPSESKTRSTFINPTPVFWSPIYKPRPKVNLKHHADMPRNLTGRFFDMLRTVLTSAEIAQKNLSVFANDNSEESSFQQLNGSSVELPGSPSLHQPSPVPQRPYYPYQQVNHQQSLYPFKHQQPTHQESGHHLFQQSEETLVDTSNMGPRVQDHQQSSEKGVTFTPVLQTCAVMGVLVVLLVLLFHHQPFQRDCLVERRALCRLKRPFQHSNSTKRKNEELSGSETSSTASSIIDIGPVHVNDVTL